MKKRYALLPVAFFCAIFFPVSADNLIRYQIIKADADELNKLGNSLNITGKTGWPVSDAELNSSLNVNGVSFKFIEITKRREGADSIFVNRYKVEKIRFSSAGLSGTIPAISFEELTDLDLSYNSISGAIPAINCPKLLILKLGGNMLNGTIPPLNLPKCTEIALHSNQLTGSIPEINCPELLSLELGNNQLSGTIPEFNFPKCQVISIAENQLTGPIPSLNLPKLSILSLGLNQLSGPLPDLQLPELTRLYAAGNKLSGTISGLSGLPKLQYLTLSTNSFTSIGELSLPNLIEMEITGGNLTGSLPGLNLPNLKILNLGSNQLSGPLPNLNLPSLEILNLRKNSITGPIPNFNLPNLKQLRLEFNQLEGDVFLTHLPALQSLSLGINKLNGILQNLNFPELTSIDLEGNNLSGPLPAFNLPKAGWINFMGNRFTGSIPPLDLPNVVNINFNTNLLTGELPLMNWPKATSIDFNNNRLSGKIPVLNLPNLQKLYLAGNKKITGGFTNSGLPKLRILQLADNLIDSLPDLRIGSPNITEAMVWKCRLTFEDLEPNVAISNFPYTPQDSVDHYLISEGGITKLYVKTGGTANQYQWRKKTGGVWTDISDATKDTLTIQVYNKADIYSCKITNTLVTGLTLHSRLGKVPSCLQLGLLEFCTEDGIWENGEKNELTKTGKITINDFLNFEGSVKIDTVKLKFAATGEFYVTDIPLPGGYDIGKFSLGKGEYDLTLLGKDGRITEFANSMISKVTKIVGCDISVTELELVGGRKATGIKMNCKIGLPGVSGSCVISGQQKTDIEIKGIEITRTDGISMEGIKISDLGLFAAGYCLKELNVQYDSKKDILKAGANLEFPFGKVGGGIRIAKGSLDSLSWRLEASRPPFILGTTTIGIKGFYGSINNIIKQPLQVELGGIFSDILSDKFYVVDAGGRTIWPSLFEVKGSGKFMKPPMLDIPYQIKGGVTMSYDHPLRLFKIGFDGKIGTQDEKAWLLEAKGFYKMSVKSSPPFFAGEVSGKLELPKFSEKFPYNWLSTLFTFPLKGESQATFVWGRSKIMHGTALFKTETRGPFQLRYVLNLDNKYGNDDYLWFDANVLSKSLELKTGSATPEIQEEIDIPANTDFAVIGILNPVSAANSSLKNPIGKVFTSSSEPDLVLYSESEDGKDAFWTVQSPAEGRWILELLNPGPGDSVILFVQPKPVDFSLSMMQNGKSVTATWNPADFGPDYRIKLFLDEDTSGFDGFAAAEGSANTGSLSFQTSDSLSACSYYLFAMVSDTSGTYKAYANGMVNNPKAILPPPEILKANYYPYLGKTMVHYSDNNDPNTVGYILTVADVQGKDSIYALLNRGNDSIALDINDFSNKTIRLTSFGEDGLQGCASSAKGITSGVQWIDAPFRDNTVAFFPNPTAGKGTILYTVQNDSRVEISVVDLFGRQLAKPVDEKRTRGTYSYEWDFGILPEGMYIIILRSESGTCTVRCILTR